MSSCPEVESPFLASLGWAGLTSPDSRAFKWGGEGKVGEPRETNRIVVCVYVCGGRDVRKSGLRNRCLFFCVCEREWDRKKKKD